LKAYSNIYSLFGFLHKLESLGSDEIEAAAAKLVSVYKDDLDQTLGTELVQFSAFVNHCLEEENDKTSRHRFLFKLLVVDTFPNVEIMLRMYLVFTVTNCSRERSFSKLKFIMNRLRTTMTNERLSHSTLMSIEYNNLRQIDFTKLIKDCKR